MGIVINVIYKQLLTQMSSGTNILEARGYKTTSTLLLFCRDRRLIMHNFQQPSTGIKIFFNQMVIKLLNTYIDIAILQTVLFEHIRLLIDSLKV